MTVSVSSSKIVYEGNGSTTAFPFPFPVLEKSHLQVTLTDADGVDTLLPAGQYTVSGADGGPGTVTYPKTGDPIGLGTTLTIARVTPLTQHTALTNQDGFYPAVLERALDRLAMVDQQQQDHLERALRFPPAKAADTTLPAPTELASRYLAFNAAGAPVASDATIAQIEGVALGAYLDGQSVGDVTGYVGDGVTVRFATGHNLISKSSVTVVVGGVKQAPDAYSIDGQDVVLVAAPPDGVKIDIRVLGVNVALADASGSQLFIPGATASLTLAQFAGSVLNVRFFGAKGDGSDDHDALAAAIAFGAALGKAVYLPGIFSVGSPLTISQSVTLIGDGDAVSGIKRRAGAAGNTVVYVTAPKVSMRGIGIDCNKAVVTTACNACVLESTVNDASIDCCAFINAKASGGYGAGLVITGNETAGTRYRVTDCRFTGNDAQGLYSTDADNLSVEGNWSYGNGGAGIELNNYDTSFAKKIRRAKVDGNHCIGNSGSGIIIANFIDNNNQSTPVYGWSSPDALHISVKGNLCADNSNYGLSISGDSVSATGNVVTGNGLGAAGFGGILFNARYSVLDGNSVRGNGTYGIDAGGAFQSVVSGNTIVGNVYGTSGTGANLGGSIGLLFVGNVLTENGTDTSNEIEIQRVDTDGSGRALPNLTAHLTVRQNEIYLTGNRVGIRGYDGLSDVEIVGNFFKTSGASVACALRLVAKSANVRGNTVSPGASIDVAVDGGGILYVPDVLDTANVTSSGTVNGIRTVSMQDIGTGGIAWCDVPSGGAGYTSAPTVAITGDGGGATAQAFIDGGGTVKGIRIMSPGSGYTTATVTLSGGGGSGATATAQIGLPLFERRELTLHFNSATTIKRVADPLVITPTGTDLSAANYATATLLSLYGQWRVKSGAGVS